jgi:hypothetical protein
MKNFFTFFFSAIGLRSRLVRYHKSRLLSVLADMKRLGTETTMPSWCGRRFQHHQSALRTLGFLEQREFTLQHRAISGRECYRAFCQLMRTKFPDGFWSYAASGSRVIITDQPSQMSEWQRFLFEYDQMA